MRKAILVAALVAILPSVLDARPHTGPVDYRRLRLHELVCCSDVVVSGTISDVHRRDAEDREARDEPDTFTFAIDETIVGKDLPSSLLVQRFRNWTCAGRWAEYEKGQRAVLFLDAPEDSSKPYRALGVGNEGDMQLEGDAVFARGYGIRGRILPEPAEAGSRLPFAELAAAVRGFREHLSWKLDPESRLPTGIRPSGDVEQAKAYRASSPTARQLFADARSSGQWSGPVDALPELLLPGGGRSRTVGLRRPGSMSCVVGDVDGDGIADLAVGWPQDNAIANRHGAIEIHFLAVDGTVRRTLRWSEAIGSFPTRLAEFAQLGRGVAPAGDLDGNGVPDLVVSAPGWMKTGSVWVLSLNRDGTAREATEITGYEALRQRGMTAGSGLGASLATLGDLDRDGFVEIAIGQDPDFDMGLSQGRGVFIVSLGWGGDVRWVRQIHDRTDGFREGFSWFGHALASLGDIDGDGVPDVAISDPDCPYGGDGRGAVWIVCLERDGTVKRKSEISDWSGNFDDHLEDDDNFGRELFALGDIDSDGVPDLAASTRRGLWILSLSRDGGVRRSRVLSMQPDRAKAGAKSYSALIALPTTSDLPQRRFVLEGWEPAGHAEKQLQWFLKFDTKGELQTW